LLNEVWWLAQCDAIIKGLIQVQNPSLTLLLQCSLSFFPLNISNLSLLSSFGSYL
jgi:hypothetical protein